MKTLSFPAVRSRSVRALAPVQLVWSHAGRLHRVTAWPDVRFERELAPGEWVEADVGEEELASAAVMIDRASWSRYLEYVSAPERAFLEGFRFGRMGALQTLVSCPGLFEDLCRTPALVSFLAAHRSLRGTRSARWAEIGAHHERRGILGVLEWLGLPATPHALEALAALVDGDVPRRLLELLRTRLWDPAARAELTRFGKVDDRALQRLCRALAA